MRHPVVEARFLRRLLLSLVGLWLPVTAASQSTGGSETSAVPSPAQLLASAPHPGKWAASVTVGFKLDAGRTETRGYDLETILAYTTQRKQLLRLDVDLSRGEYGATPGADLTVVDESYVVSGTLLQGLSRQFGLLAIGSWRRDVPLGLHDKLVAEAGVGYVIQSKRLNLLIGPGIGIGRQSSSVASAPSNLVLAAIEANLTWNVTSTLVVQNALSAHYNLDDHEDRTMSFNVSGTVRIGAHSGLKLYYQYQYDRIHDPSTSSGQREIGGGVTFAFPE
jgi:hypothetical protein